MGRGQSKLPKNGVKVLDFVSSDRHGWFRRTIQNKLSKGIFPGFLIKTENGVAMHSHLRMESPFVASAPGVSTQAQKCPDTNLI